MHKMSGNAFRAASPLVMLNDERRSATHASSAFRLLTLDMLAIVMSFLGVGDHCRAIRACRLLRHVSDVKIRTASCTTAHIWFRYDGANTRQAADEMLRCFRLAPHRLSIGCRKTIIGQPLGVQPLGVLWSHTIDFQALKHFAVLRQLQLAHPLTVTRRQFPPATTLLHLEVLQFPGTPDNMRRARDIEQMWDWILELPRLRVLRVSGMFWAPTETYQRPKTPTTMLQVLPPSSASHASTIVASREIVCNAVKSVNVGNPISTMRKVTVTKLERRRSAHMLTSLRVWCVTSSRLSLFPSLTALSVRLLKDPAAVFPQLPHLISLDILIVGTSTLTELCDYDRPLPALQHLRIRNMHVLHHALFPNRFGPRLRASLTTLVIEDAAFELAGETSLLGVEDETKKVRDIQTFSCLHTLVLKRRAHMHGQIPPIPTHLATHFSRT
jgi:hypothetical protein